MKKMTLVVIDMLNDFLKNRGNPLYIANSDLVVERIGKLIDLFHKYNYPIVFAQDAHRTNDADFSIRPIHAIRGTWGAELIDELKRKQMQQDYIILKRRHSAFSYTDLELFLREEAIEKVILAGIWTNVAIRNTASDAFYRPFQVTVIEDCCMSQTEEMHLSGLRDISLVGTIMSFHEFSVHAFS